MFGKSVRCFVLGGLLSVLSVSCFGISNEQVGTYSGVVSGKRFDLSTAKPVSIKVPITVTLASDNSYNVTVLGELLSGDNASIGASHGSINLSEGDYRVNMTLHFTGDQVKGAFQFFIQGGPEMTEGKVTLRKDPL